MKCKLSSICHYVDEKKIGTDINNHNYVSTENMLPNKQGIVEAITIPPLKEIKAYKSNDVLVSNIRPYFKKIWFAKQNGGCSSDVLIFRANNGIIPRYLYYILSNNSFFDYSMATSKGTKMPRGDKKAIMNFEIPTNCYKEQMKIATVLNHIDEKISINNRINKNLEQQAQAIFKSWFIDNPAASDWSSGTFSDIIETMIAGDWGKESSTGNNTEMVYCIRGADIPEVKAGNKGKMPTRYILPKNYTNKHLIDGDVIVEISGGSPTQSTGRIAAVSKSLLDRYDKGMVCTNFCKAMKPKAGYSMFVYYYWQYLYDKNVFFSYENGTTGIKNLDISGFIETEPIVIPPADLVKTFDTFCKSVFDMIFANGLENEHLSTVRDTLLPQLMSGELDVSNVDI